MLIEGRLSWRPLQLASDLEQHAGDRALDKDPRGGSAMRN
jgi:hypothetical protein